MTSLPAVCDGSSLAPAAGTEHLCSPSGVSKSVDVVSVLVPSVFPVCVDLCLCALALIWVYAACHVVEYFQLCLVLHLSRSFPCERCRVRYSIPVSMSGLFCPRLYILRIGRL